VFKIFAKVAFGFSNHFKSTLTKEEELLKFRINFERNFKSM